VKTLLPKVRYKIEQVRIDDMEGVQKWNLEHFAAEFGHTIEPVFPIFAVFVDGELACYYYAQPQVCLYPAIHPGRMTPRMIYEVGKVIVAAAKRIFGNPLWMIEEHSPANRPVFLRRLFLRRTKLRVYETDD
jgi:hypothetical protein